jgi:DNA-binding transcriptional MerR regulator
MWNDKFKDWEGSAEELVKTVGIVVGESVPVEEFAPNVRLLRHYQSIDAVSRPERRGKEAVYRYRHLLEVIVVRHLVIDGWPLKKISSMIRSSNEKELFKLLPEYGASTRNDLNAAQKAVRNIANESAKLEMLHSSERHYGISRHENRKPGGFSQTEKWGRKEVVDLELTDWCRISLDRGALRHIKKREIEATTDAFKNALSFEISQKKKEK